MYTNMYKVNLLMRRMQKTVTVCVSTASIKRYMNYICMYAYLQLAN